MFQRMPAMQMPLMIAANGENTFGFSVLGFWIIFSCVAAAIAHNKGNSVAAAVLISILLSPLIGIIVALVQKRNEAVLETQRLQSGASRKCPFCAELIKKEARVCRYCGRDFDHLRMTWAVGKPESAAVIYLFLQGKVQGPYTTTQVEAFLKDGSATLESLCCVAPSKEWQPLRTVASVASRQEMKATN